MDNNTTPTIFISHITEESEIAHIFKKHIEHDFLGTIDVFISSDTASISPGDKWLGEIDSALQSAKVMLIICSKKSVKKPWINFEAGAGWVKKIPVIPICHSNILPSDLPMPLNMLQAIEAKNELGIMGMYKVLSEELSKAIATTTTVPSCNFTEFIASVNKFENAYGFLSKIASAVSRIMKSLPETKTMFCSNSTNKQNPINVESALLGNIQPHLDELKKENMLSYKRVGATIGGNGYIWSIEINVSDNYYAILKDVIKLLN